jgi:hypothetical protein
LAGYAEAQKKESRELPTNGSGKPAPTIYTCTNPRSPGDPEEPLLRTGVLTGMASWAIIPTMTAPRRSRYRTSAGSGTSPAVGAIAWRSWMTARSGPGVITRLAS